MKKILLFIVCFWAIKLSVLAQINSQSIIYLKNGSVIRGSVIEQIPDKSVKIQTSDKSIFVYEINEVEKITKEIKDINHVKNEVIYLKNGSIIHGIIIEEIPNKTIKIQTPDKNIFVYNINEVEKINQEAEEIIPPKKIEKHEHFFSNKKNNYFSIATGVGSSYGDIGIRLQARHGRKLGFGYHVGLGVSPHSEDLGGTRIFITTGLKFFWYKAWYINCQFGPTGVYRKSINSTTDETGIFFGPSFLLGGDWFFNKYIGLNGAIGVATNITEPEVQTEFFTADFGFIVKF